MKGNVMEVLQSKFDFDTFFQTVRATPRRALLLDYDGTLAPFQVERGQAVPYPGVREVLNRILGAGHTRLAIISGRVASDLLPLLGLDRRPEIWGTHGWERLLPDGRYTIAPLGAHLAQGLVQARTWIEEHSLQHTCEDKPTSIAVHWRGLSPRAMDALRAEVLRHWAPLARQTGLGIHEFDGGLELRAPGRDKGSAVRTVRSELGAEAVMAYLGDDMTDEDAFQAMQAPGIGVLVRSQLRPTAADLWLQPPAALLDFLTRWHQASLG
jgi:trehalose 6-phosphate phosphatase